MPGECVCVCVYTFELGRWLFSSVNIIALFFKYLVMKLVYVWVFFFCSGFVQKQTQKICCSVWNKTRTVKWWILNASKWLPSARLPRTQVSSSEKLFIFLPELSSGLHGWKNICFVLFSFLVVSPHTDVIQLSYWGSACAIGPTLFLKFLLRKLVFFHNKILF